MIKHRHCHHDLQDMMITDNLWHLQTLCQYLKICKSPGFRIIQPLRTIKDVLVDIVPPCQWSLKKDKLVVTKKPNEIREGHMPMSFCLVVSNRFMFHSLNMNMIMMMMMMRRSIIIAIIYIYYYYDPINDGSLSRQWLFHTGPGPIGQREELEEGDAWQVTSRSPRGTDQLPWVSPYFNGKFHHILFSIYGIILVNHG